MKLPPGVWFSTKVLADRSKVRYGYFGRGPGRIALGREGTPDFYSALAELTSEGSITVEILNDLIVAWRKSPEFVGLRLRTRADYSNHCERIKSEFGKLSLKAVNSNKISRYVYAWRDRLAESGKRQADMSIAVLRTLLNFGISRGYLDHNRALKIRKIHKSDRSQITWTQEQIDLFLSHANEPMRWAFLLALFTGQRQSDVLKLRWADIDQDVFFLVQGKTNAAAAVPVMSALATLLSEIPRLHDKILTNSFGVPWDEKARGLRTLFYKTRKAADIKGVTFHDLRGTFITFQFAEGKTVEQVASQSGHSIRSLGILDKYTNRKVVSIANARKIIQDSKDKSVGLQTECKPKTISSI